MNDRYLGRHVLSIAGHDFGKQYVIIEIQNEYVYLVDGKIRTLDRPKKKKIKHIELIEQCDPSFIVKVINKTIKNEEIKRSIKLMQKGSSSKEVE